MGNINSYYDKFVHFHHSYTEKPNPSDFIMHMHDKCEIFYFLNGKGVYKIEGNEYPLRTGDMLILKQGEAHYIDVDPNYPYERLVLSFNAGLFSKYDKDFLSAFFQRDVGTLNLYRSTDFANETYLYLIDNILTSTKNTKMQVYSNLFALLNEIYKSFQVRQNIVQEESIAYSITSYINRHILEDITLDRICERFFISKSHLCRIFKDATASTVAQYIRIKRLLHAQSLIEQGEAPTKAALLSGFNDYSVFYRNYTKYFEHSPSVTEKT